MSLKAMVWAINEASVTKQSHLCILMALADNADDTGRNAWPSVATIARKARCSVRSVYRYLEEMENAGLIRRGDESFVKHLPANRRPIVWDLVMSVSPDSRDDSLTPLDDSGVTKTASRGDSQNTSGVTAVAYKQSIEPIELNTPYPLEGKNNPKPETDANASRFHEFATAYPIKKNITRAERAYTKALTITTHDTLLRQVKEQHHRIIAQDYPAYLWLRNACYQNPLPPTRTECLENATKAFLEESRRNKPHPPPKDLHEMFVQAGIGHLSPKEKKCLSP